MLAQLLTRLDIVLVWCPKQRYVPRDRLIGVCCKLWVSPAESAKRLQLILIWHKLGLRRTRKANNFMAFFIPLTDTQFEWIFSNIFVDIFVHICIRKLSNCASFLWPILVCDSVEKRFPVVENTVCFPDNEIKIYFPTQLGLQWDVVANGG